MKRFFSDLRFYESYSYAQSISNILRDQFAYLRDLDDFYGDGRISYFCASFPKNSALHAFIEVVVTATMFDENSSVDLTEVQRRIRNYGVERMHRFGWFPEKLPIDLACEFYGIEHQSFADWLAEKGLDFLKADNNDVSDFLEEILVTQEWELLIERIVQEVFFILFQNRHLLLIFNEMMANQIRDCDLDEVPEENLTFFTSSGKLRRFNIPTWAKRAVFYRDRGLCVECHRDLSGLLVVSNAEHFDHIVPLAEGGMNDVTNLQLLCSDCNLKKSHRAVTTSTYYESWYSMV